MLLCIKHHLRNIWSSINETLSNTKAELKKAFFEKPCISLRLYNLNDFSLLSFSLLSSFFVMSSFIHSSVNGRLTT